MVTYEKFIKELIDEGVDKTIVKKLIEEYRTVKREHFRGDNEKVILHSAKFSDLILALIKNKVSGKVVNVDNIRFSKLLQEIKNYPKLNAEDVILTLAIPRVAESVYTIRSKKDVVHVKTIDPNFIDSSYCVSACDWMFSELVLLFFKADPNEASELINSMLKKKVPTIEEFEDGSVMVLRRDLSVSQEIMLTFYHFYPKRLTSSYVKKCVKATPFYVDTLLLKLEDKRLVHKNSFGYKLTKLGIKYVEDTILKKKVSE